MKVTWLHISDFHIRSGDPYDRDVVLRSMVTSVKALRARGRVPDLIFATGDIAHSGKPAEYDLATAFFDALLAAAGLERQRLFVIPGNHDVDRDLGVGLARTLSTREEADTYFGPKVPKSHLTQKLGAFLRWHNQYFAGIRAFPENSTCGPVEAVEIRGCRIGVLPLNSALFCQDDNDHAKLCIGRRCLDQGIEDLCALNAHLKVALVHHPLDWLSDVERGNIKASLQANVDLLLRGHLHETDVESVVSATGGVLQVAAGATYQTRKWPNRALYATFEGRDVAIFPIRYEDQPREVWTVDPSLFPEDTDYERRFQVPRFALSSSEKSAIDLGSGARAYRTGKVHIEVQEGDILKFPADVLALKYAQDLHGADLAVYQRLSAAGRQPTSLPRVSGFKFVDAKGVLAADAALFVGVEPLRQFGYQEIREFGRKVLVSLAGQAPNIEHIALTIHGPGYGLDESEAFESELAGVIDAIVTRDCPANLRRVSFVERNPGRAGRLREALGEIIPNGVIDRDGPRSLDSLEEQPRDTLRNVGYNSADKPRVFVAMPFMDAMDDVFHYGIQGAVKSAGFLCERADLTSFVGDVMEWVRQRISGASFMIADLTTANPNVYLEVGYSWGCGCPTVLLVRDAAELKFDVKGQRCLVYKSIKHLEEILGLELQALVASRQSG